MSGKVDIHDWFKYLSWKEKIDEILHRIRAPKFIQRPVCDWIDRTYYD